MLEESSDVSESWSRPNFLAWKHTSQETLIIAIFIGNIINYLGPFQWTEKLADLQSEISLN